MPNTIEDKITLFTKVILERIELDFQKKQNTLTQNHNNRVKNIIDDYEKKKKLILEKVSKEVQSKSQHQILKTRTNLRLAILKKKNELMEKIFKEIKKRIKIFVQSKEYGDFLEEIIKKVLTKFSPEQYLYFKFSSNDIKNRSEMILNTINSIRNKDTYRLDVEDYLIGGVFVKSGDGLLEVDYTINDILDESHKLIGEVLFSYLDSEKEN